MTKLNTLKTQLEAVKEEQKFLEGNSFVIGASKRLVSLCKKHSKLENKIADLEFELA